MMRDEKMRPDILVNVQPFFSIKSLDPSHASLGDVYEILKVIGSAQDQEERVLEFHVSDDLLTVLGGVSHTGVDNDDPGNGPEITEIPDPAPSPSKKKTSKRKRTIVDSPSNTDVIPDFSPAVSTPIPSSTPMAPAVTAKVIEAPLTAAEGGGAVSLPEQDPASVDGVPAGPESTASGIGKPANETTPEPPTKKAKVSGEKTSKKVAPTKQPRKKADIPVREPSSR